MLTEEYEVYMKKQEATFKTEVTAVVQEPRVGDIPPMEQTTTIISGQVGASIVKGGGCLLVLGDVSFSTEPFSSFLGNEGFVSKINKE